MNKAELLQALEQSREELLDLLEGLEDEQFLQPGVCGDWSLKDVLAHLTRWEAELVKLLWQAAQGQTPTSAHFSRLSVDELNQRWQREMTPRPLAAVLEDFHGVRAQTMRRLEDFSDRDLADPQRFRWLGGRALWQWIAEDSFLHERQHAGQIKRWREGQGQLS